MKRTTSEFYAIALVALSCGCAQEQEDVSYRSEPSDDIAGVELASFEEGGDRDSEPSDVIIDRSGGIIRLDDGSCIEIPEGTVKTPTEVRFTSESATVAVDCDVHDAVPVGPVLLLATELHAPANNYVMVSIPVEGLPYRDDGCQVFLIAKRIECQYDVMDTTPVSENWSAWRAVSFGDRLVALLGDVYGMQMQFITASL